MAKIKMDSRPSVRLDDLEMAFEFVSAGEPMEYEAYLSLETGTIYYHSEYGEIEEPLPEDIDDQDKYVLIPQKKYFGLGRGLALSYAEKFLPNNLDIVRAMFNRSGAFHRFKELLATHDQIDTWRMFESEALTQAIRQWCEENEITIEG